MKGSGLSGEACLHPTSCWHHKDALTGNDRSTTICCGFTPSLHNL